MDQLVELAFVFLRQNNWHFPAFSDIRDKLKASREYDSYILNTYSWFEQLVELNLILIIIRSPCQNIMPGFNGSAIFVNLCFWTLFMVNDVDGFV